MPYYPKSQITTNLYTNGEEFQLTSPYNQETSSPPLYVGYYFTTSKGKSYTGKFPGDGDNFLLYPVESPNNDNNLFSPSPIKIADNDGVNTDEIVSGKSIGYGNYDPIYNKLTSFVPRFVPQYYSPIITQQNRQQGYIDRYFCKKTNEYKYIEISKDDFSKLSTQDSSIAWDLYSPIKIKWNLINPGLNSSEIQKIENNFRWVGFKSYVKPALEEPINNPRITTSPPELINRKR